MLLATKKLYKRIKRGQYILNPQLKIRIADEWKALHDVLSFEGWGYIPDYLNYEKHDVNYLWGEGEIFIAVSKIWRGFKKPR